MDFPLRKISHRPINTIRRGLRPGEAGTCAQLAPQPHAGKSDRCSSQRAPGTTCGVARGELRPSQHSLPTLTLWERPRAGFPMLDPNSGAGATWMPTPSLTSTRSPGTHRGLADPCWLGPDPEVLRESSGFGQVPWVAQWDQSRHYPLRSPGRVSRTPDPEGEGSTDNSSGHHVPAPGRCGYAEGRLQPGVRVSADIS